MIFSQLGLSPSLTNNLSELGYLTPTNIQQLSIPKILEGKNLIASGQTGTGKTASFILPILELLKESQTKRKKRVRAIVMTPTRELAEQIDTHTKRYAKNLPLTSIALYGGKDYESQKKALLDGVDILIATLGRLRDMYTQKAVHFDEVEFFVLDEADKMLNMGFIDDINDILSKLPPQCQHLLFSATLTHRVRALAKTAFQNPVEINSEPSASKSTISQWLIPVDKDKKSALLSYLITSEKWEQALIFIETKHGAAKLVEQLRKRGIDAESFHSGRSQIVREQLIDDFKKKNVPFLVATGVAARGIDITDLSRVINYDLPFPADDYIHRIGRTGRANATGEAITLLSKDDFKNLCMIETRLGHLIERREIEQFSPKKPIPLSILNYVPKHKQARINKKA